MSKTVPPLAKNEPCSTTSISLVATRQGAADWLLDCELRQHSQRTIQARKDLLSKLFWFLERGSHTVVGTREIREFLSYLATGHNEPGGRFDNPKLTTPLRPVSIHSYYKTIKAMYRWLESDGAIETDPMRRIKPPVSRTEVKQPLTPTQLRNLISAAKRSQSPLRNVAIVLTLADSGIRASELCQLRIQDVNFESRSVRVLGKGNKFRTVYLGREATRAMARYLKRRESGPNDFVFTTERYTGAIEPLSRGGLLQLLERLGIAAGVPKGLRNCHCLRRTNAVNLLRNGANVFAVQSLLGHSDLQMTRRYVSLAEADVEATHRACSPIDRLRAT